MTKKEVLDSQIEQIMDEFDFDRVQRIMTKVNWTWGGPDKDAEIPNGNELRKCAKDLLKAVVNQNLLSIGTGGFCAIKIQSDKTVKLMLFWGINSMVTEFDHQDFK